MDIPLKDDVTVILLRGVSLMQSFVSLKLLTYRIERVLKETQVHFLFSGIRSTSTPSPSPSAYTVTEISTFPSFLVFLLSE
jgi:hypothetical protein